MGETARQDAFVRRLDDHRGILFKIAGLYCPDRTDREDLVQEMALQLWRSFDRFDGRGPFSTWMYRVCLNVAISFVRRERVRARHAHPADAALLEIAAPEDAGPAIDGALATLRRRIEGLGALDRALVLLHLEERPHREIAAILGLSESNVGTRLARIRERIRRAWAQDPREESP